MKAVHRASVPNLQRTAQAASHRIREICKTLRVEISANTVSPPPGTSKWLAEPKLPENVTYPTPEIERILWQLVEMELELRWWSTPVDQRGKLDKPFSLR